MRCWDGSIGHRNHFKTLIKVHHLGECLRNKNTNAMKNQVLTTIVSALALLSFTGLALAAKPTTYKCSKSTCGLIQTYASYKGTNIKCPKCGSAMTEVRE